MGAQTVRTVTPLSKCRATWCFFPAQTPATREKPPNSRSNPHVSQYTCLPWAGKRDKGSVGQNKEPTKETRNRLNFSWGNIGRKPKFFIRRKHCIGPRHSSKKAILPQRFVSSPWRERPTKIQELPTAVLPCLLNWKYSTTNTVHFPPFMPFLVVLSQVSCKTFGYVKIHGSIRKQWNHWNQTNNCHKWLTQHNMNISTCGGWISRCGVMAWARFQTCLEKMRSLHYHFILNSPRPCRRRLTKECFIPIELPLIDQFPRSTWSLYSPGISD